MQNKYRELWKDILSFKKRTLSLGIFILVLILLNFLPFAITRVVGFLAIIAGIYGLLVWAVTGVVFIVFGVLWLISARYSRTLAFLIIVNLVFLFTFVCYSVTLETSEWITGSYCIFRAEKMIDYLESYKKEKGAYPEHFNPNSMVKMGIFDLPQYSYYTDKECGYVLCFNQSRGYFLDFRVYAYSPLPRTEYHRKIGELRESPAGWKNYMEHF